LEGYAFVADPAVPNQLVVKLPIIVAGVTLFENPGDYQVWETDYDNYSIVYSCTQIVPGILKSEVTWILSRSKTLDGVFVQNLKNKLVAKHATFPVASFIPVAQDC
jgi:lipocalin